MLLAVKESDDIEGITGGQREQGDLTAGLGVGPGQFDAPRDDHREKLGGLLGRQMRAFGPRFAPVDAQHRLQTGAIQTGEKNGRFQDALAVLIEWGFGFQFRAPEPIPGIHAA